MSAEAIASSASSRPVFQSMSTAKVRVRYAELLNTIWRARILVSRLSADTILPGLPATGVLEMWTTFTMDSGSCSCSRAHVGHCVAHSGQGPPIDFFENFRVKRAIWREVFHIDAKAVEQDRRASK
jgi:hypothetical protein